MTRNKKNKNIVKAIILGMLIAIALLFFWISTEWLKTETKELVEERYFEYEAHETTNGEIEISILEIPDWPEEPALDAPSYPLQEEEYFDLIEVILKEVWGDTLANWQVHELSFMKDCKSIEQAYFFGSISLFRVGEGGEFREIRHFIIDPHDPSVSVHIEEQFLSDGIFPLNHTWESLDMGLMHISSHEAFLIADAHSGEAFRLENKTECEIWVSNTVGEEHDGWYIRYFASGAETLKFTVNTDIGEINKTK